MKKPAPFAGTAGVFVTWTYRGGWQGHERSSQTTLFQACQLPTEIVF
jgi:hypothetical protein